MMIGPEPISGNGAKPAGHPAAPTDSSEVLSREETLGRPARTVRSSVDRSVGALDNFRAGQHYEDVAVGNANCKEVGRSVSPVQFPFTTIDFVELSDGSLIDFVEDPKNPKRTLLALWNGGEVDYRERLEYEGQTLIPPPREGEILKHIRLPRGAKPYASNRSLLVKVAKLIDRCVSLIPEHVALLSNFVLSTWLVDRLPIAPYVSVVGLPQSGKTRLLQVLRLVCRRPLLTADITSATFYLACAQWSPTLLIDEAGTLQDQRALYHLLRVGTSRDVVAMRKNQIFHAYGPKVLCWLEPPDDAALNSRCLQIYMTEADNSNLDRPTDPDVGELATELQAQLLQFRFENYKSVRVCDLPGTETLRPRSRDLLACLAAPFAEDADVCKALIQLFKDRETFSREPLSSQQSAVLAALFFRMHLDSYSGAMLIKNLTAEVNSILRTAGQPLCLQPRKVGAVLATLGFWRRERTNAGWNIILDRADQERVHKLVGSHGIDYFSDQLTNADLRACPLCQEMHTEQKVRASYSEWP
jgi:hypothetical protein